MMDGLEAQLAMLNPVMMALAVLALLAVIVVLLARRGSGRQERSLERSLERELQKLVQTQSEMQGRMATMAELFGSRQSD